MSIIKRCDTNETVLFNRYCIMHGRKDKEYTLNYMKVLNLVYGTMGLGQLGQEDA